MNRYTLAVLVRNQFGVLNRLTSMFRRRQFNISSITASETESADFSRITFSFDGEEDGKHLFLFLRECLHQRDDTLDGDQDTQYQHDDLGQQPANDQDCNTDDKADDTAADILFD